MHSSGDFEENLLSISYSKMQCKMFLNQSAATDSPFKWTYSQSAWESQAWNSKEIIRYFIAKESHLCQIS